MKIVVCIKQVPAGSQIKIDEKKGTLIRGGGDNKTNPYDLFALEAALKIKETLGATVTVLTMGPPQAEEAMRDAFLMGADEAVIMTDPKFSGSDVLATSHTLAQGITLLGDVSLIICGKQTTDGDTAQIGPAIAEQMGLPHVAWIKEIQKVDEKGIETRQDVGGVSQIARMEYPCLITVEKDINVPRLPSYKKVKEAGEKNVRKISCKELPDKDPSHYGAKGSPTKVIKMFPPTGRATKIRIGGASAEEKAATLLQILTQEKYIREGGEKNGN
ncbi:MAG: electron transfer flavoprotein subunit beta/FixA family protein [Fusobacteriaceae bacterium]|nr:electron transfer flavoprotein subunit beta/FixA family protein [Fusobacteriaceae bacterium]